MPVNQHIIPKRSHDPGAAQSIVDLRRQVRNLQSQYGVVGDGAAITGPLIETADSGQRVFLQGPDEPGGAGLFATDPSGNVVISLTPGAGLGLTSGQSVWNKVTWYSTITGTVKGDISNFDIIDIPTSTITGNNAIIRTLSPNGGQYANVQVAASNTAGSSAIVAEVEGKVATVLDGHGSAKWPGGVGMFLRSPPTSQPATPTTLAGVISILQSYGLCS